MEEFGSETQRFLTIGEVEVGKNYAMVITTNGGLWRADGNLVLVRYPDHKNGRRPRDLLVS
jgi:hypothetical protein